MVAAASNGSNSRRFDEFFNEGIERHARAAALAGIIRRRFCIAGMSMELRFAGPVLVEPFTAALAHLEIDSQGESDFVFNVYDEASTGVRPPRVRWDLREQFPHGEVQPLIDADRYLQVELPRRRAIAGHRALRGALVWLA